MHESPGTRGVARHCDVIPLSRHATPQRKSLWVEVRPSRAVAAHHSAHATATPPSDGGCVAWASPSSAWAKPYRRAQGHENERRRGTNVTRLIATFHKSFAERHPPPPPPTPPLESGRLEFIWRLVRRLLLRTPSGGGSPREGGGKQ